MFKGCSCYVRGCCLRIMEKQIYLFAFQSYKHTVPKVCCGYPCNVRFRVCEQFQHAILQTPLILTVKICLVKSKNISDSHEVVQGHRLKLSTQKCLKESNYYRNIRKFSAVHRFSKGSAQAILKPKRSREVAPRRI